MKNNLLITGAAGFIGSNLSEYFCKKGYDVLALDNLSTGHFKNIEHLASYPNFKFIEGDIRDVTTCDAAVKGRDFVMHQAALGSVPRSLKDPITSNEVNVGGFLNMLVASNNAGVKKMIYAASSSTYGDSQELPKKEGIIGKPLSPYAVTKFVNELYAGVFYKSYGFNAIGLRYFNVFGRKQSPEGAYAAVIPLFTKKLMNKESPIINGDGSFSRDFTYIDNVIQANERAMLSTNPKSANNIFNVACGEQTDLNSLVDLLKEALSRYDESIKDVEVIYGPTRDGDIPHSLASIQKAKEIIEYDPKYDIKKGLNLAVDWYWNNL
ncbi:UDP-N-acetylglucosamine 4-epimerase [Nonlabens dokdonensis]|uniref:UDP-glucose 4-epimerase n=2 Tax=Nonlabens dokdonensis TaxID=328515 RepID=L7WEH6_NONDD|nr:SDR family oxidoreductase [Nonlabens dokdonensis]AGC78687.1 UDP-glucose 4-epimerase [Nonlabens dokdonensis DSW-6]PZX39186.1 UDP-N-acetylglucosamine 4-epimerase [Nonlabens dokdonensis]